MAQTSGGAPDADDRSITRVSLPQAAEDVQRAADRAEDAAGELQRVVVAAAVHDVSDAVPQDQAVHVLVVRVVVRVVPVVPAPVDVIVSRAGQLVIAPRVPPVVAPAAGHGPAVPVAGVRVPSPVP